MHRSAPAARRLLDPRTREILATAHVEGARVQLAEQLTTQEYAPVGHALAALGGLYCPPVQAFIFPATCDPAALIAGTLRAGTLPLHPRTAEGWVRTPDDLADELCGWPHTDLRWLLPGSRVLEPSAGIGSLAAAVLRANPGLHVTAVEPNADRATVTAALGPAVDVHGSTFEDFVMAAMSSGLLFDGIVMNPPFAVPGERALWVEHLRLAWHLLRPGARLVCVVPNGLAYRSDAVHRDIRAFIDHHGTHDSLPGGAFAASGTGFATRVVRLTRPVTAGVDHLFGAVGLVEPVRVDQPRLTGQATTGTPVQVWWDPWRRRDRVVRYRGRCVVCGWLLWGFDDGENDPRGVLGDFTAGFSLDPADFDREGPQVGLCCACANNGDTYHAGVEKARAHWYAPARQPLPAAA